MELVEFDSSDGDHEETEKALAAMTASLETIRDEVNDLLGRSGKGAGKHMGTSTCKGSSRGKSTSKGTRAAPRAAPGDLATRAAPGDLASFSEAAGDPLTAIEPIDWGQLVDVMHVVSLGKGQVVTQMRAG